MHNHQQACYLKLGKTSLLTGSVKNHRVVGYICYKALDTTLVKITIHV